MELDITAFDHVHREDYGDAKYARGKRDGGVMN
jgi:hypothetical protein